VLLYLATAIGSSPAAGTETASWTDDGELAWDSTPLFARLRGKKGA
jgi:hypothetical protein